MVVWIVAGIAGFLFLSLIGKSAEHTKLLKTSLNVAGKMFVLGMAHKTRGTPIFMDYGPDGLRFHLRYVGTSGDTIQSTLDIPEMHDEPRLKHLPDALIQWTEAIEGKFIADNARRTLGGSQTTPC